MGLKDQSMALKWVKDNISYFGGNPDNITVLGSSSAACDLHMHMMSPMSKGGCKNVSAISKYSTFVVGIEK